MLALFLLKGHLSGFFLLLGVGLHFSSGQHHNTLAPNAQQMCNNIVSAKQFIKSGNSNTNHIPASLEKPAWGKQIQNPSRRDAAL